MRPQKVPKSDYDRVYRNLRRQYNEAKKSGIDLDGVTLPKRVSGPTTASVAKISETKAQITNKRRAATFKKRREATREEREKKQSEDIAKERKRQQYKAYKRREKARKERAKKQLPFGARGTQIIQKFLEAAKRYDASLNFKTKYSAYYSMRDGKVLTARLLVEGAIKEFGKDVVARRIEDNAVRFNEIFSDVLYSYTGEEELDNALAEIEELLFAKRLELENKTENILQKLGDMS